MTLEQLRIYAGVSLVQASQATGLTLTQLTRVEAGAAPLSALVLYRLLDYYAAQLGVSRVAVEGVLDPSWRASVAGPPLHLPS